MPLLEQDSNWSLVAVVTKDLSQSLLVDLGRRFTSEYLIVRVSTSNKKDTWYYGGKLWASFLVLGQQTKFYQSDLDLLGQELLAIPSLYDGKYSLLYEAPKFLKDVTLRVWEYVGSPVNNSDNAIEADLNFLKDELDSLSKKIADISSKIDLALEQSDCDTSNGDNPQARKSQGFYLIN